MFGSVTIPLPPLNRGRNSVRRMDTAQFKKMRRHRHLFRFMGVMWALAGGMLVVAFLPLVFDPHATINYNGVATTAVGPKLFAVLFAGAFLVAGLCFLFAPARLLDRLFVWRQSALSSIAFWRH